MCAGYPIPTTFLLKENQLGKDVVTLTPSQSSKVCVDVVTTKRHTLLSNTKPCRSIYDEAWDGFRWCQLQKFGLQTSPSVVKILNDHGLPWLLLSVQTLEQETPSKFCSAAWTEWGPRTLLTIASAFLLKAHFTLLIISESGKLLQSIFGVQSIVR